MLGLRVVTPVYAAGGRTDEHLSWVEVGEGVALTVADDDFGEHRLRGTVRRDPPEVGPAVGLSVQMEGGVHFSMCPLTEAPSRWAGRRDRPMSIIEARRR